MRLFKKKDDGSGNRSDSRSPAPSDNPYAQQPSDNPYNQGGSPYNQGGNPYGQGGNPYNQGGNPYNQGGTPYNQGAPPQNNARSGAYAQAKQQAYGREEKSDNKSSGYSANPYGASGGYGTDRYNTGDNKPQASSRYGPSGYGGFGGRDPHSQQDDPNKQALFGGASERAAQNRLNSNNPPPYDSGSAAGDYRGGNSGGYGSEPYNPGPKYEDRQLTAEEEEEEHVNATKQEIRAIKQNDVAATRNALRLAQQAEEVGRDTLARLGVQSEYIYNTERNLDLAHTQNKMAEDKARELKTLNRSMFAVHVSNPFTAKSRDERRDADARQRHEEERVEREATRREQFLSNQRMEKTFNDLANSNKSGDQRKKNLAERSKYQFEADSEDEDMENEIDSNLTALSGAVNSIRLGAVAIGQEVTAQSQTISRIHDKSDKVDVGIASNTAKLNRIR